MFVHARCTPNWCNVSQFHCSTVFRTWSWSILTPDLFWVNHIWDETWSMKVRKTSFNNVFFLPCMALKKSCSCMHCTKRSLRVSYADEKLAIVRDGVRGVGHAKGGWDAAVKEMEGASANGSWMLLSQLASCSCWSYFLSLMLVVGEVRYNTVFSPTVTVVCLLYLDPEKFTKLNLYVYEIIHHLFCRISFCTDFKYLSRKTPRQRIPNLYFVTTLVSGNIKNIYRAVPLP